MKQYPIIVPFIFEWIMDLFLEINTHRNIFIGFTIINVIVAYLFIKNRRLVRVLSNKNDRLESVCLELDEMRDEYQEQIDKLIYTMVFVYREQQGNMHEFKCHCAACTSYYNKLYSLMFEF